MSPLARAAWLGGWAETRTAAATMTEANAKKYGKLGAGGLNNAGTELHIAVPN